jgi:hypothetical protein
MWGTPIGGLLNLKMCVCWRALHGVRLHVRGDLREGRNEIPNFDYARILEHLL